MSNTRFQTFNRKGLYQRAGSALGAARRGLMAGAASLSLLAVAGWPAPTVASDAPLASSPAPESGVVINATFPEGSGPNRFLTALSKAISDSTGVEPDRARVSPADLAQLADRPGQFFVLSNQELFPAAGQASAVSSETVQALQPVAPVLVNPFFVVVSADGPYTTLEQLLEQARQRPGAVSYGSWGARSPGRKYGAILAKAADAHMVHVAYPNLGALYDAVARGEVDWALGTGIGPAAAAHRAGKIRYLAIADSERDPQINVPTLREIGLGQGLHFRAWLGLFASAGTDIESIAAMQKQVSAASADTNLRTQYASIPAPDAMTANHLQALMDQEPLPLP